MTMRERMNERKMIKKSEGFFSPKLAKVRPIDSLREHGFDSTTIGAYAKTWIPFSQTVNDIRNAKKEQLEGRGGGVLGIMIGYTIRDLIFAIPYAIKIYSSGGTSVIPDVQRGAEKELGKQDIDIKEVVSVGKQAKEFYDKTKKTKE
ncbi:MAG: hypothetical protein GPJ52_02795 [Candidatus Heimdallarchaeota archaeon]|nr:hypothetical protein [Candidatus Heimdallarchaeota archaeon]